MYIYIYNMYMYIYNMYMYKSCIYIYIMYSCVMSACLMARHWLKIFHIHPCTAPLNPAPPGSEFRPDSKKIGSLGPNAAPIKTTFFPSRINN